MAKIIKNDKNSVIVVDPYDYKGFRYHNSKVEAFNFLKTVNKHDFFISYIEYESLKTATLKISRSIEDEYLENEIVEKYYEEFQLDPTIDYKVCYIENRVLQSDDRFFNVFIVKNDALKQIFKNIAKKIPYIDCMVPEPLLYSVLYKKGLLVSTQVDCFVTLKDKESFLSVYTDGEFLTSKKIRYTLSYLNNRFFEQSGERLDSKRFQEILSQCGLINKDRNDFNYDLNAIFEDCVFYINDIINIINRDYQITIKNIYIDCDYEIKNFANFISTKLGLDAEYINIKVAINNKNYTINERYNVMALFGRFYTKEPFYENFNLSNMLRPDPFVKRKSGKFLLTCAVAFALSMLYPAYNYIAGLVLEKDSARLNDEYSVLNAQEMQIKETLAKISREQEAVKEQTQKENEKLNFRKGLLAEIENKKDNYAMKGLNLFKITDILNLNAVHITNIVNNDRNLTITAVSDNEKRITQLIKDISKDEKYLVNTKKIRSDDAKHEYESNISIEIRQ